VAQQIILTTVRRLIVHERDESDFIQQSVDTEKDLLVGVVVVDLRMYLVVQVEVEDEEMVKVGLEH